MAPSAKVVPKVPETQTDIPLNPLNTHTHTNTRQGGGGEERRGEESETTTITSEEASAPAPALDQVVLAGTDRA